MITNIRNFHRSLQAKKFDGSKNQKIIYCQGICKGIETACLDLEQKKYIVIGIKVTAIAAK